MEPPNNSEMSGQEQQRPTQAKKYSRIALVIVVLVGLVVATFIVFRPRKPSPQPPVAQLPTVEVKAGRAEHDFGYVEPAGKRSVVFGIQGQSNADVKVRKVSSSCECINVPNPPAVIAAGATTEVRVDFQAPKEPRDYSERIVLQTADAKQPPIVLGIKARVGLPLEAVPALVKLGKLGPGERRTLGLRLVNHGKEPIRPVYSVPSDLTCIAEVPLASIPAQGELTIPLAVRAPKDKQGEQRVTVDVHTDCPAQPYVRCTIEYLVSRN